MVAAESKRLTLQSKLEQLRVQQKQSFNECLGAVQSVVLELEADKDAGMTAVHEFASELLDTVSATDERLTTEEEQLRLKSDHVEKERALVTQETEQVEETIQAQV